MDKCRLQLAPDLWLDARRAVWLSSESVLVVADLHLGYAWAHRQNGQLLPIAPVLGDRERLLDLMAAYSPKTVVLLGDIVHRAIALPPIKKELCSMLTALRDIADLVLIAGNHDRRLKQLLDDCEISMPLHREFSAGTYLLTHGDAEVTEAAAQRLQGAAGRGGRVLIGHEHPTVTVGDRVATSAKCPCFLVSETVLVLPAFTEWSAGSNARAGRFMSPYANSVEFTQAIAIMGDKLLPLPLKDRPDLRKPRALKGVTRE